MPPIRALFCLCLALSACASAPPTIVTEPAPSAKPEGLAACLARKGAHLYGASWCHWCHVQLEKFGPDAPKVPYTDCDPQGNLEIVPACTAQGVDMASKFPVWMFEDGSRLIGVRSLQVLALVSGCPAP